MSSTGEPTIDASPGTLPGVGSSHAPPWAELYRSEAPRLMRLATAIVGRDEAYDLVADTVGRLVRRPDWPQVTDGRTFRVGGPVRRPRGDRSLPRCQSGARPEQHWRGVPPRGRIGLVGTFQLLDHTIVAHREGGISGVCVERSDGVSGCALLPGVEPDGELPPAAPTKGVPLSDGTWVAVGSIANGLEPCEEPLLQGARAAVVPNGDVQTMLVVPADLEQSFACPLTGTPTAA